MADGIFRKSFAASRIGGIFRRSFTKYLLSYIFCLILPVAVFSVLYKTIFLSAYSRQLEEKTGENLYNAYATIDLQINNLHHISSQILSSREFSDSVLEDNPRILSYLSIREILSFYSSTNEFIVDIWFFNRNSPHFYSPSYILSLDSFIRYGPGYPELGDRFLPELLSRAVGQVWIPETAVNMFNRNGSLLTCVTAYPNSLTHSNGVLTILVRKDIFERPLEAHIPHGPSNAALIDSGGQILYALNPSLNGLVREFLDRGGAREGAAMVRLGGEEYFYVLWISPQNKLTYLSLIPRRELSGAVNKHTTVFFCILLLIMISGSFLIFFLMRSNYKPIQRIVRYSREQRDILSDTEGPEEERGLSDIDLIQQTLEKISRNNHTLEGKNKKYLRDEILFRLLKGSVQANPALLQKAGIDTGGVQYGAVIFRFEGDRVIPKEEFGRLLEKNLVPWSFTVYLLDYLEKNSFIGIFVCRQESPGMRDLLENICREAGREAGLEICAAYGDNVGHIGDISRSYFQARMALRYQIRRNARKILGFQEMIPEEIPDYPYLQVELKALEDAIGAKKAPKVDFIISELIDTVKNERTSYFFAVCLCYDIINIFIREIYKTKNAIAVDTIKKYQRLFLENSDHPVENLIGIVVSLSREAMRAVTQDTGIKANRNNILKYIEEHYRDSDFCVQSAADHFGLSISNLSHQFKSSTGENIAAYISALKMGYAKELLSLTDMPVNEIAGQLGYFQTSSFIKKFKGTEGVTPGEYRLSHRKKLYAIHNG
jgi:AraC-like DNA-binding protein